ncbi:MULTISPECIES: Abi family protein [unclassified Methylobacterium]|uniref:Abi family protein n=2 Tax=Methylobacterium TaxID=407 RepID=UPI00164EF974|nr:MULTISPECIES: Abi family protein [unclassified Methylobacterium]
MEVADPAVAEAFISNVGYYRLSGFYKYYLDPNDPQREKMRAGVTFDDVVKLYEFDRRLRALLSRALERIEISIKSKLSHEAATAHGAFWLCEPVNFDRGRHAQIIEMIDKYIGDKTVDHQHVFINHFMNKYSNPYPPCWMMMELFSFGALSKVYKLSKGTIRKSVADQFGLQHDILESWLHSLSFARNVCAHHGRVWNKGFTIKPKIPKMYNKVWPDTSQDKLYSVCAVVWHLLSRIDPASPWPQRLATILDGKPNVTLAAMGFPDDWQERRPWASAKLAHIEAAPIDARDAPSKPATPSTSGGYAPS